MKEWDYDKNTNLDPNTLSLNSHKKVWWLCPKGHSYASIIASRTRNHRGCPYCSGQKVLQGFNDLATLRPDLEAEWNYEKNLVNNLSPQTITIKSGKKVWWKCSICGKEWQATVAHRMEGTGCPGCRNKKISLSRQTPKIGQSLQDINPLLANEWHPTKNGNLTPKDVKFSCSNLVWWLCKAGHEWQDTVNHRNNGRSCPICNKGNKTSYPEQCIFFYLKKLYPDTINRYQDNRKEIDIYIPCLKMGFEYDGIYYHPSSKLKKEQQKDKYFLDKGIKIIRIKETQSSTPFKLKGNTIYFYNDYQLKNLTYVIQYLLDFLRKNNNTLKDIKVNLKKDNPEILEFVYTGLKENNVLTNPILAKEWNYKKNGLLNPKFITLGSRFKVWWKCSNGHEWQATIASRSNGAKCPICSNQQILPGYNDLSSLLPDMAKEWDYDKNYPLQPEQIGCHSHKKIWWKCTTCGFKWKTSVSNRTRGTGCPKCAQKSISKKLRTPTYNQSLQARYPNIALEWDNEKNGNITPKDVYPNSSKIYWWKCNKGHSWQAVVSSRTKGHGCPFCTNQKILSGYNDLATLKPAIAEEWNYNKNHPLKPNEVSCHSGKKVWWICKNCKHEWQALIKNRSNGTRCPKCRCKLK